MGPALKHVEALVDHDPVKLRHRASRMEASAAIGEAVMVGEVPKAAATSAPFVEVPHQHRAQLPVARGDVS